jgi:hypothetical protein
MALPPKTFITIHKARMDGMDHADLITSLEQAGDRDPVKTLVEYARTKLPDGRLAGQMNPADPHEWDG